MTPSPREAGLRARLFRRHPAVVLAIMATITAGPGGLARGDDGQLHSWRQPQMGTWFTIRVWVAGAAGDADALERAEESVSRAFARIEALNQSFSDYLPDSELNALCDQPAGSVVELSAPLADVLDRAQQLSRQTDGAFDVTLGPMIRLWRLARKNHHLPSSDQLADARSRTGYQKLTLDSSSGATTASLAADGMQLDLGGIAKGFAADAAMEILREDGFPIALVAAAGDIAVGDPPPGREQWRVGIRGLVAGEIETPDPGKLTATVDLVNAAISTSGDLEQSITIDGVRYSHIVDPATGLGLTRRRSVTVIAPTATESDSLATACSVLAPEASLRLIETLNAMPTSAGDGTPVRYAVRIREIDADDDLRVTQSPGFPAVPTPEG